MSKQIYLSTGYSGGAGGVYSLYGAEPYLPAAFGSSGYSADGTIITGVGERASYVYNSQSNGLRDPIMEIPGVSIYSAGKTGAGLNLVSLRGADGLGVTTTVNAESKRSAEALYNQSVLAHNTIGASGSLLPTHSLVKRPKLLSASHLPMYPQRPGEKECLHYMLSRTCKFGEACKFDHPVWVPEGGFPYRKESVEFSGNSKLPERQLEAASVSAGNYAGYREKNESTTNNSYAAGGDLNHAKRYVPFSPALLHNSKGLPIRPGESDCPFYLKTGSCKYAATCRYSHPDMILINPAHTTNLSNAILTPPVASFPAGVMDPSAAFFPSIDPRLPQLGVTVYPQRPGENHCDYYMRTGHCNFGERCKFHHPIDRSAPTAAIAMPTQENAKLTLAGFPRREGLLGCPFYMKTGTCKFGVACCYDHPPPEEAIAMAQVGEGGSGSGSGSDSSSGSDSGSGSDSDSDTPVNELEDDASSSEASE